MTEKSQSTHPNPLRLSIKHGDKISNRFKAICRLKGLGNHRFLELRHTFGVRRYLQMRDIYQVMKEMGHAKISMTEKYAEKDDRIKLINHEINQGPRGAIITGYLQSSKDNYDIAVVVGGDYQMPLDEINNLLDPVIDGESRLC